MTIQELRQLGFKVRVLHFRGSPTKKMASEPSLIPAENYLGYTQAKTRVEVRLPDGIEVVGEAYCHPTDSFQKRIGVQIALNRALGSINHIWTDGLDYIVANNKKEAEAILQDFYEDESYPLSVVPAKSIIAFWTDDGEEIVGEAEKIAAEFEVGYLGPVSLTDQDTQ